MHFSIISVLALAALVTASPVQVQLDVYTPDINHPGALKDPMPPYSPADLSKGSTASDDKLDIQYGQCYRIRDSNDEKLGLYNNYYQFGGADGNRPFRVCREVQGACKHEDRNDQTVRRHEHFYLKDSQGSAFSRGASWMAVAGWYLHPLPWGGPPARIAQLWGYPVCTDPDIDRGGDDDPKPDCEICVSQKVAWNHYPGLSTQPRTKFIIVSRNPDQCVYLKFTKVRCPSHVMGENEDIEEDEGNKMLRLET